MRDDLNKLLCEKERRGSTRKYREVRRSKRFAMDLRPDAETFGGREGMKFRYGYECKDFNENLSPLKGQIRRAVGKTWDAFYSDLCQHFDKRSVINQHILQHLDDFIERDVVVRGKQLFARTKYSSNLVSLGLCRAEYFVDPRTGIIRHNKYREMARSKAQESARLRQKADAEIFQVINEHTVLRKVLGTWFIYTLKPIVIAVWDVYEKKMVGPPKYRSDPKVYHAMRRTASKKFLKEHLK